MPLDWFPALHEVLKKGDEQYEAVVPIVIAAFTKS